MVTSKDVMDINPLERMEKLEDVKNEKKNTISAKKKELEELEKQNKKRIEELEAKKKKELEELEKLKEKENKSFADKKKELEELEKKKTKEIEETEELIEKSFQELMRHKKIILAQEEKIRKDNAEKDVQNQTIDEIAKTAPKNTFEEHINYNRAFDSMKAPSNLYDVNRNFYQDLSALRNKAASGEITPEEEQWVDRVRGQFERFEDDSVQNAYVKRSLNLLDQIDKYQSKR